MLTLPRTQGLGQVRLREHEGLERLGLRVLAKLGEGQAHLGEEALDRRQGCRAAEVLPRHHLEVRELLLVLKPPDHRVLLSLSCT